jgi:hypothetical protein
MIIAHNDYENLLLIIIMSKLKCNLQPKKMQTMAFELKFGKIGNLPSFWGVIDFRPAFLVFWPAGTVGSDAVNDQK